MKNNLFEQMRIKLLENKECLTNFDELEKCYVFLEDLSFLFFGRTFIANQKSFNCSDLIDSLNCTLWNAIECIKNYCLADSMTLLRKFKDDLWFILYIMTFNKINWENNENELAERIDDWSNNKLKYLTASKVIESVFSVNNLSYLDEKYNIKDSLKNMARKMDDYVHSNGISFYNSPFLNISDAIIEEICTIKNYVVNNLLFFILIIAICFPHCLASSDYEDYFDCDVEPPEGCQYWIAPFVSDFLSKNKDNLDRNLKFFLQKYSCMDFSNL